MKVLFLALLVVLALAQQKPVWPVAASTSLLVRGWERPDDRHSFRWFYDESLGKERFSGPTRFAGEFWFTETVVDTKTHREVSVIHQEGLVICFNRASNITLPHPNFDTATYVGKSEINYEIVDHWSIAINGRPAFEIYDRVSDQKIVRLDYNDPRRGHTVTYFFYEWDAAPQDPALFTFPADVLAICVPVAK